jgi:LAS superfamily LD-carboxypeptidase LdcB
MSGGVDEWSAAKRTKTHQNTVMKSTCHDSNSSSKNPTLSQSETRNVKPETQNLKPAYEKTPYSHLPKAISANASHLSAGKRF